MTYSRRKWEDWAAFAMLFPLYFQILHTFAYFLLGKSAGSQKKKKKNPENQPASIESRPMTCKSGFFITCPWASISLKPLARH